MHHFDIQSPISTSSHAFRKRRPAFEPQKEPASNGPIYFQIHYIDWAKNCRLVQNAMGQRERAEREIQERKRQTHPKVPCTTSNIIAISTTNQAISFIQLALKHTRQAGSVETVSSLFVYRLTQEERGSDPEISYCTNQSSESRKATSVPTASKRRIERATLLTI
jgi:hypothetical protein